MDYYFRNKAFCLPVSKVTLVPKIGVPSCRKFNIDPQTKVSAYKFLHKDDIEYWRSGSIRIDLMSRYAREDDWGIQKVGGVGDEHELFIALENIEVGDPSDPSERRKIQNLDRLGAVKINPGHIGVAFESIKITRSNRFISCFADTIDKKMFEEWNKTAGYDYAIKINDICQFTRAVEKADKASKNLLTAGGAASIDWVEYIRLPIDNETLNEIDVSDYGFYKDRVKFGWQKEIRISWPLLDKDRKPIKMTDAPYDLTIPNLSDFFTEIGELKDY